MKKDIHSRILNMEQELESMFIELKRVATEESFQDPTTFRALLDVWEVVNKFEMHMQSLDKEI